MELQLELLSWQKKVLRDETRFKVIVAGRRTGKSRFAAVTLLLKALDGCPRDAGVLYVAPTQGMARVIMWRLLLELAGDLVKSSHANNGEITLVNDVVIYVRGADNPDTLRGMKLWYAVLDEYADMKPLAWETVIRAALSDLQGAALFIGTPKGRSHFYDLYNLGHGDDPEWKSWVFTTADNELIDKKEIEAARRTLSTFAFKQEYMASFDNAGTDLFKEEWIRYGEEPAGSWYIACDLAGFQDVNKVQGAAAKRKLDETGIAVVKVTDDGKWWIKKIEHGRWDVRETAVRILKNIRDFKPLAIGIEKGTTFNAVMPYLTDLMRKNNIFAHIKPLSHGNQKKTDRIVWALQGRFEHGRVYLNEEGKDTPNSWQDAFIDQLLMFPTDGVHDDLCFVAGTMIQTPTGQVPIEEISVGDVVSTPIGYRKVYAASMTNKSATVYSLNNGLLVGTASHPIMTPDGYTPLHQLTVGGKIVHLHNRRNKWLSRLKMKLLLNLYIFKGTNTTDTQIQKNQNIVDTSSKQEDGYCSTEQYGNTTMGKFPLDSMSITRTGIGTIMTFPIWSVFLAKNILSLMQQSVVRELKRLSTLSIWNLSGTSQKHGTHHQRGANGIGSVILLLGKIRKNILLFAKNAEKMSKRISQVELDFVERLVLSEHIEGNIQTITQLKQKQPVYNLGVKDASCYYANGVLVHNCDCLSMIDQMAVTSYMDGDDIEDEFEPLDIIAGI